jgi:type IV pilus assembly protein PilC
MRAMKLILETVFWSFAAGVAIFGVGVLFGMVFAPALGYFAAVAVIGLLPLSVRTAKMLRRRRGAMALAYLEQAVRLNLPLPRMLRAAQQSEPGMLAYRLAQLRQLIEEGYPIGAALESSLPEVGERETAIIDSSERIGRLPQALAALVHEQAALSRQDALSEAGFYRIYPLVMLVMLGSVMSMFTIFVLPKFEAIFKDFGTKLPPITQATVDIARAFGPGLLILVAGIVLIASGSSLWQTIRPVRFRRTIIGRLRDYAAWATPLIHGAERDRGLADVFDLIAAALAVGTAADRAINEASRLSINHVLRKKIYAWAISVESGQSIADGARAAGLPAIVVGMLSSARDSTAVTDVFAFLARYYRTRFSRTAAAIRGMSIPLMVLFFGFIVACVALSMFLPLISLIQNISAPSRGGL